MPGNSLDVRVLALLDEALEQTSADRDAWIRARCVDDGDLCARALALLGSGSRSSHAIRTGGGVLSVNDAMPPPDRIGAYRITGLIGQGGMGTVYRAERATGDFEHVAAIKLIRPGALSEALVDRFQRERQTLARLAHPNIARLFDGGETETGQPYIVMEFVDGLPLDAWIAAAKPDRIARIALFLGLCSAVGFAHQNLIIHRDITPANILVEKDGAAKLIDFGIARPSTLEPTAEKFSPTQRAIAGLSLTPGYAAPERLAGGHATTLTDIYSLGVLLGRLLEGEIDPDLAAIVAKATAREPEDRYATVDGMCDDVTAWRDGEVVSAREGGRRYAIGKFIGRHRAAVASAMAGIVLLVGALAATLVANRRAETALAEAQTRFEQTRSIAKVMMFDVYDAVSAVPGSTDARFLLASTAQRYIDALAADPAAPVDVRLDVGEGYFRLARVVGYTGGGSLGRREDGKLLFDRSQRVLTALHAEAPDRADVSLALAHLLAVRAGERLYAEGDSAIARREASEARILLEALPQLDARGAGALARAYIYEGDSWGWDNDIPAAGRVYEKGLARVKAMPPALRNSEEVRTSLTGLLRQSGDVYRENGETERAIERHIESVAVSRGLVAASKASPASQHRLVTALWSLADMYRVAERYDLGHAAITEAQSIAREGMRAGASDSGPAESVALTGLVLAQIESARSKHPRAVAAATEAIAIRRELTVRSGDNKGARITLAVGLKDAAPVYLAAGNGKYACSLLQDARTILEGYQTEGTLSDYDRENNLKPVIAAVKMCVG
jgi:serine/threonine-protein kinase